MNQHLLTIILVGRPNVGKSTLFNRLLGRRLAIEYPEAHTTRDALRGIAKLPGQRAVMLVDTAGDITGRADELITASQRQRETSLNAADHVLAVFAAPDGLTAEDERIIRALRRRGLSFTVVAAKADNATLAAAARQDATRRRLTAVPVSALHNRGLAPLRELLSCYARPYQPEPASGLVLVGRPNAGKSTLLNTLVQSEVSLVHDQPGTTRDVVTAALPERHLIIYDTAGRVRRARSKGNLDRYITQRQEEALEMADCAVLCLDGGDRPATQDARLAQHCLEAGLALVLAVTKWDNQARHSLNEENWLAALRRRFHFAPWLPVVFISSLTPLNLEPLLDQVQRAVRARRARLTAAELEQCRQAIIKQDARFNALRQLVQTGARPPHFVATVTRPLPISQQRQLLNQLRAQLDQAPTPLTLTVVTVDQRRKQRGSKNRRGRGAPATAR